jgi:hypothetical protein
MSNDELFQQVQLLLQRKLTPEECRFLTLAGEVLNGKHKPPQETKKERTKIA